jgi:hypothetical protein
MRAALGLLVAAALSWLVFRDTAWGEVWAAIRGADPLLLAASQVLLWAACFARAWRWSYVVRAVQPARFRSLFSATQIGLLANFSIPARVGELVRASVLARLEAVALPRALALVTLDRVNDVAGLLPVLGVAAFALAEEARVVLPPGTFGNEEPLRVSAALVRPAAAGLAAAVAGAAAGLVLLWARRDAALSAARAVLAPLSAGLAERVAALLGGFADGLHVFRSRGDLARALSWSCVTWGLDALAVAALLAAFGLSFDWKAPCVVLGLVSLALVVPLTPGTVGQFHLPAVAGLLFAVPGVGPDRAKAVALVDHAFTLLPVVALGSFCLLRERLGLRGLLREGARDEAAARGRDGAPLAGSLPRPGAE